MGTMTFGSKIINMAIETKGNSTTPYGSDLLMSSGVIYCQASVPADAASFAVENTTEFVACATDFGLATP